MAFHSDSQIAVTCCSREFDIYITTDGSFCFHQQLCSHYTYFYCDSFMSSHLQQQQKQKRNRVSRVCMFVCVLKTASDQITISRESVSQSVSSSRRGENFKESDPSEVSQARRRLERDFVVMRRRMRWWWSNRCPGGGTDYAELLMNCWISDFVP